MTDFFEDVEFLRTMSRKKPKAGDDSGARVASAISGVFRSGYNGNHSAYPTKDLRLDRARITPNGRLFERVSDLWYPPKSPTLGRAHLKGESRFYCAVGAATAIIELRPKVSDVICVMHFRIDTSPMRTKIIMDEALYDDFPISCESRAFERFASTEFRRTAKGPRDYLICGALGSLFFSFTKIDAIMYGSMASGLTAVNLAIAAAFADAHVKPLRFDAFEVTRAESALDIEVRCIARSRCFVPSGAIRWEGVTECPGHRVGDVSVAVVAAHRCHDAPLR